MRIKNKEAEQTDALNSHAFGTFGTSPAGQVLMQETSWDSSLAKFGNKMTSFHRAFLVFTILASTGCRGDYAFPILEAKQREGGFDYTTEPWWPEGYGDICFDVRRKTSKTITLCIVEHDVATSNVMAYAFTGNGSGNVFLLKPAGIDSWEIVADDKWQGSAKEYFEKKRTK